MIRVLSVLGELNCGGGENRVLNIARSIDRGRFRLTVVTLYAAPPPGRTRCTSMSREFADAGVDVHALAIPHPAGFGGAGPVKIARTAAMWIQAVKSLRALARSECADVVDAHLEPALLTAVPAAVAARVPVTATLYSEVRLWDRSDSRGRRAVLPGVRRRCLRLCSGLFTDSAACAAELRRFIGPAAPPVYTIPNGVQLGRPFRSRDEVLRLFGVPRGARVTVVGQIAGLVPFKGQSVLIDAVARVVARGHDVYALCVGDARLGPEQPLRLRAQARALGIAERVRIGPYEGNVADVWNAIDIHVHPSSIDSMPNAVIEGMSLGKPAVLAAVGGIPDHVEDERTGLLVAPDAPAAVERALLRFLADPALAQRMGAAARQRYLERFTPEVTTRQVERCLEALVAAHPARRAA